MNSRWSQPRRGAARAHLMVGAGVVLLATAAMVGLSTLPAQASDVSTSVACTNQQTGDWEVRIHFDGLDVRPSGHVLLTFGDVSRSVTLTGDYSLARSFTRDDLTARMPWAIDRNGHRVRSGVATFSQPPGCRGGGGTGSTTQPPTTPATTQPPTTGSPGVPSQHSVPPQVLPTHVMAPSAGPGTTVASGQLPETGGTPATAAVLGVTLAAAGMGLVLLGTRRRSA